ncbi:MAG: AsmA family protein, partial [Rubrivivax sp.]|nr:AsmA family protein [Rubrivivax sp.]
MKRPWIRRFVIAVGALVLLLAAAAVLLVVTFDANRYKALAIDWMKTERQRTLTIDGPVELSVWPRLALKASRLRLSERGRADEFMAADEAALAVQVLPLLRKQLVIDRVSARGVRATYLRDAQGVRNFDDLVSGGGGATSTPAPALAASAPALRFDVGAVQLDDLQLRLRDETVAVAGVLAIQTFTSGRLAPGAASPVALRAALQLTQPQAVRLVLDGSATVALDLGKDTVTLSGLKVDVQGDAAGVTGLALALEGALAWDGT